jgi:hypothetical protein
MFTIPHRSTRAAPIKRMNEVAPPAKPSKRQACERTALAAELAADRARWMRAIEGGHHAS